MKAFIRKARAIRLKYIERSKITAMNCMRAIHNYERRMRKENSTLAVWNALVNQLSNWQRNQWAKKGYPGLQHKVVAEIQPFTTLTRSTEYAVN